MGLLDYIWGPDLKYQVVQMIPIAHLISINKESNTPVYRQIAVSIIMAVRNGTLKANAPLPGSRELAKDLGVHRKTVVAAYEELSAQEWITVVPRKRITVSEHIPELEPANWKADEAREGYQRPFELPFRTILGPTNGETGAAVPELVIDDGHPDIRLSPIDPLLKTYRAYTTRRYAVKSANVSSAQGTHLLREEMVKYLSESRGLHISIDNILVTHGAQMSIYLSAQLLLGAGSNVIVGKPGYPVANMAFGVTGANILEVDVDENGIDTEAIGRICQKKKIVAVYVIPHHHYPTTVTLSVERRMKLLELSRQYNFTIIEDDYDFEYHYTSAPYLPLASAGHQGNVIYIGSFSKILGPSIRIGFMIAPKNFVEQCAALRMVIDVGNDSYMQNALAGLMMDGELSRHLKRARKIYHQRRDFLDGLMDQKLGRFLDYTLPSGGMAIWVRLRPEYPVTALEGSPLLHIKGVYARENAFRFGFASMNEEELESAVDGIYAILAGL